MATHNRLLGLGDLYLEVIAADPSAPRPAWPRWFDLDRFTGAPRLTNWICACDDLEAAVAAALSALWHKLLDDTRHHSVELIDRRAVEQRLFADWSLAFSSRQYRNTYGLPGFFHTEHDPVEALMEHLGLATH